MPTICSDLLPARSRSISPDMKALIIAFLFTVAALPAKADTIYDLVGSATFQNGETIDVTLSWDATTQETLSQSISSTAGPWQNWTYENAPPDLSMPNWGIWDWQDVTGEGFQINLGDHGNTLSAGIFGDMDITLLSGTPIPGDGELVITDPVTTPEPSTIAFLLLSIPILLTRKRRR